MSRRYDNAPIGNTCPMIDTVIAFIEGVKWNLEDEDEAELSEQSKEALKN